MGGDIFDDGCWYGVFIILNWVVEEEFVVVIMLVILLVNGVLWMFRGEGYCCWSMMELEYWFR